MKGRKALKMLQKRQQAYDAFMMKEGKSKPQGAYTRPGSMNSRRR